MSSEPLQRVFATFCSSFYMRVISIAMKKFFHVDGLPILASAFSSYVLYLVHFREEKSLGKRMVSGRFGSKWIIAEIFSLFRACLN